MVGKAGERGKANDSPLAALTSREKPSIRAAGADFEVHPLRTSRAMADISGPVAVGVHAGIHVAAGKVHTQERTGLLGLAIVRDRGVGAEIELRAFGVHSFRIGSTFPPAEAGSPGAEF
jgi:hypothetical protein